MLPKRLPMLELPDIPPGEWTHADLQKLPDDGNRYEIIDGVLYVSPSPKLEHQDTAGGLYTLLRLHCRATRVGRVYIAPLDVIFSEKSVVEPDIVYVKRERYDILRDWIHGSPDLAVEVLSSNPRLDRVKKLNLYAKWKVPHYWLVDPLDHTLEALELHEGTYRYAWTGADDDVFQPSLFPGLELPLNEIWPESLSPQVG